MTKQLFLAALLAAAPAVARANGQATHVIDPPLHVNPRLKDCSIQFAPELTQAAFHRFVREFGSVSAFKQAAPPIPMGRGHVAVGIQGLAFTVEEHSDAWNDTFAHPDADHELGADKKLPMVRARVGLTETLDLGGFYTENANANYGWVGAELSYAVLRQDDAMPVSVALRGAYTRTIRADDLDLHAATVDVSVGRTYRGFVTPYVGVGSDALLAHERSSVVNLEREMQDVSHGFAGVGVRFGHLALDAEVTRGALTSFQVQVASVF